MEFKSQNRLECRASSQVRFGHTQLNDIIYVIGKHFIGKCKICNWYETVEHVLNYRKHTDQREK